jgi:cell division septum initiation protein DivIVA
MGTSDLDNLFERVDRLVDDLKVAKAESAGLKAEKKKLEERIALLEKQLRQGQKEGDRLSQVVAQNKAYKKKQTVLKSKVISMLAKVEGIQ